MPAADIHMCHCSSHLLLEKQAGQSLGTEHRLSSLRAADQCICTDMGWSCLLIPLCLVFVRGHYGDEKVTFSGGVRVERRVFNSFQENT